VDQDNLYCLWCLCYLCYHVDMEVCQAERLCGKRFLVPAAACLPYQAALAKAYPLQFLNAGFVTFFEVEVLVAVAFGGIVFSETAAAQGQVAAVVIAELGQTMATVAVLLTAESMVLVVPAAEIMACAAA
jgi:hypothetical protein